MDGTECGSNCEPFDLYQPNLESIICIFEFTNDGVGFKTFTGNEHDFLNPFSELICGKGYVIVLKPHGWVYRYSKFYSYIF